MPENIKLTITLPPHVYSRLEQVMKANGIDRSAAVAMCITRVDLAQLLPPGWEDKAEDTPRNPSERPGTTKKG